MDGTGEFVTGKIRLSCILVQKSAQGEDQMEEFPAWICMIALECKWCLTCKIEDQYTERGPIVGAVQKVLLG
jgi:hypothetical protein